MIMERVFSGLNNLSHLTISIMLFKLESKPLQLSEFIQSTCVIFNVMRAFECFGRPWLSLRGAGEVSWVPGWVSLF